MKHMLVVEADNSFIDRNKVTPIVRQTASYPAVMRIELYHVP